MIYSKSWHKFFAAVVVSVAVAPIAASVEPASLDRVALAYASARTLHMTGTIALKPVGSSNQPPVQDIELYFSRPGKFWIKTRAMLLVSDGKTTWRYRTFAREFVVENRPLETRSTVVGTYSSIAKNVRSVRDLGLAVIKLTGGSCVCRTLRVEYELGKDDQHSLRTSIVSIDPATWLIRQEQSTIELATVGHPETRTTFERVQTWHIIERDQLIPESRFVFVPDSADRQVSAF